MGQSLVLVAGKDPLQEIAGGHSSYVRAHARAALSIGLEPHLFCVSTSGGDVFTDYGVVHRLKSPYGFLLRRQPGSTFKVSTAPIQEQLLARGIAGFIARSSGPQIVHGFGPWSAAGVTARAMVGSESGKCTVFSSVYSLLAHEHDAKIKGLVSDHGLRHHLLGRAERWWINHALSPMEDRAFLGSDRILVNYDSVIALLRSRLGRSLQISKIPYTSEAAFLPPPNKIEVEPELLRAFEPRDVPLIVSVSRHDPRKGLHILLCALARLKKRGIAFRACLIGRGQLLQEHRRLARELQLERETLITGLVDDPRLFLRHAQIFVLPSLEESSGSVSLIEALEAGLACVVSDIDGIPEDVTHNESALLTEPGNVDALAESLSQVLLDSSLRSRLGNRARTRFETQFSVEKFSTSLKQVYAESLDRPVRSRDLKTTSNMPS